jgi:protease-4
MSNGSTSKGVLVWAVLATVFLAFSLAVNLALFVTLVLSSGDGVSRQISERSVFHEEAIGGDHGSRNKIAVIYLTGLISYSIEGAMGQEGMVGDIKEQLRLAGKDKDVKAVVLVVDSPGGEVTASDEIYRAVAKLRDGGAGVKKPVVVSMGSLAASGGYYVAVGGSHLMASESTITGSIGVILQSLNYRKLLDKVGLDVLTIKSGKFKDLLSGSRQNTAEEVELVQELIMESYDQFVGIVAKERGMKVDDLKTGLADGRVFSGRQAKKDKLIDSLGYYDDAVNKAKELAKIRDARQVKYIAPVTLRRLLQLLGKSDTKAVKVQVGPETLKLQSGKLYYVAEQFVQ